MAVNIDFFTGFDLARALVKEGYDLSTAHQALMCYGDQTMFTLGQNRYASRKWYEDSGDAIGYRVMDIYGSIYMVEYPEPAKNLLVRQ